MTARARKTGRRPAKYSRQRAKRRKAEEVKDGFVLTAIDGVKEGTEHFYEHAASIGRVEENEILLVEPGVSRRHARVYDDMGAFMIEDLGSSNGTRLNGDKIEAPEVLRDGDYITIGQTTFQFSVLASRRGEATAQMRLDDIDRHRIDSATKTDAKQAPTSFLRSRRGKLLLGLAALLLVAGVLLFVLRRHSQSTVADQSDVPLSYSEDDAFFNSVFGYGRYDKSHRERLLVDFEYLTGRVTIQFGAWGVDKVDEVVVLINGEKIGRVPLTMGRWVYGVKLVVPHEKLKKGKTNRLEFNNTRNPPHDDTWEICYLQVLQEALPPPDPKQARHRFELAKKAWEDREVEPRNMYAALSGFKQARDLLEGLAEKPELYQESLDWIDKVDKALTRRFQEGLFSARRAEKVDQDVRKARTVLIRTLRYFRQEDFRHRELKRYLDALSGG